jgi:hypothetical protein
MKLATVAALAAVACPMAVAQNFPPIPEPWDKPMTPRMHELVGRLQDLGLLARYDFSRQFSGPPPQVTYTSDCSKGLMLASATLAFTDSMPEDPFVRGWIENLPLVESLLKELYGDMPKYATDLVKTITLIKERCVRIGRPIDESPYQRFSDVPMGHWADDAIHRLRELGIVKGYSDNTFRM